MSDPRKKKIEAALEGLFSSPSKHSPAGRRKKATAPIEGGAIPTASQGEPAVSGEASTSEAPAPPAKISPPTAYKAYAIPAETESGNDVGLPSQIKAAEGNLETNDIKGETLAASAEPVINNGEASNSPAKRATPSPELTPGKGEAASPQKTFEACQLVIFKIGHEYFGVPIHSVDSIIQKQAITRLPRAKPYISGLTNLRGVVLPVINLRKRLEIRNHEESAESNAQVHESIVVALVNGEKIGVQVDAVTEVITIPGEMIAPPPPIAATNRSDFLWGIAALGDRSIMLLDLGKTLEL